MDILDEVELHEPTEYEWDNSLLLRTIEVGLAFLLAMVLIWFAGSGIPGVAEPATWVVLTILFFGIFWAIDVAKESNVIAESVGWGDSGVNAIAAWFAGALITGLLVAVILVGGGEIASASFLPLVVGAGAVVTIQQFGISFDPKVLWSILSAPAEEIEWRGIGIPTGAKMAENLFGNTIGADTLGIIMGATVMTGIWAFVFHLFSYGWHLGVMIFLFINGLIWFGGNNVFKSSLFGYGGHITLNLLVLYITGLIPLWWVFVPSVAVLICGAVWNKWLR